MAAFSRIKAGDVLYDVHRERAGNTLMTRIGCWTVRVLSVNQERKTAECSWNGNPPQTYSEHRLKRLRRTPWKGPR